MWRHWYLHTRLAADARARLPSKGVEFANAALGCALPLGGDDRNRPATRLMTLGRGNSDR
jgi:hypothetical protein